MVISHWLDAFGRTLRTRSRRHSRTRRTADSRPVHSAAAVEILEDRTLLALFLVNTTADTVDANPGDGSAFDANNRISLRSAIMEANALAGADSIILPTGTYTLSIAGVFENLAATGDLDVTDSLTISGAGADLTIVDADGIDRVFDVAASTTVNFHNLTITGGQAVGNIANILEDRGGAIRIDFLANVLVSGVTFSDNAAPRTDMGSVFGLGGAIENAGSLTITDSHFENNLASNAGGAISSSGGGASVQIDRSSFVSNAAPDGGAIESGATLIVNTSTFSGNNDNSSGSGTGGAINNNGGGTLTLTNSTLSGNDADLGGGLNNLGSATILNSTIAGNSADTGGGIRHSGTSLDIENSVVADNTASVSGPDVDGTITSSGHNLISDTAGSTGFGAVGDILNVPALLGPLADNGGPTQTHEPLVASQAVNNANNATAPATDQRGVGRPIAGTADIGAVERRPNAVTYVVDSLLDENDGVHTAGNFSLREAIALSNASESDDVIDFAPGLNGTIVLTLQDFDLTGSVTINGPGAALLTIDANNGSRHFTIDGTTTDPLDVTISGMTLLDGFSGSITLDSANLTLADVDILSTSGRAIYAVGASSTQPAVVNISGTTIDGSTGARDGGAILNDGNVLMTITASTISNNTAQWSGGAILSSSNHPSGVYTNVSELRIIDSTISDNQTTSTAAGGGGAINKRFGALFISGSTFADNHTAMDGGAISMFRGTADIANSSFTGNSANDSGGAIDSGSSIVRINASTIVGNRADANDDRTFHIGGGINTPSSSPESFTYLNNTIVAGNVAVEGGVDLPSDLARKTPEPGSTHNLIGDAGSAAGLVDGVDNNIVGVGGVGTIPLNTILDPTLADNGGPTQTHALVAGSPALESANPADSPATDQRGVARPQGLSPDVGAFEFDTPLTLTIDMSSISENGGTATGTLTRLTTTGALTVYLVSHDTSEVTVPASVVIPDGSATATFPITAVDDDALDGTQTVAITASTGSPSGNPSLDATFGTGGIVVTTLRQSIRPLFNGELDTQPDGKVLAIGRDPSIDTAWILNRYHPDGSPDATFGTAGSVTTDFGAASTRPEGIIQHPDGKITVVGTSLSVALVAQYLPDGTPDPLFGTGGQQTYNLPGQVREGVANDDGTMFLVGRQGGRIMLVKLASDGSLDTTYGTGGIFTPDLGPANNETADRIDRQSDGRIIVSGAANGTGNILAVRFTADGALDTTFGTSGYREVAASGPVVNHSDRGGTGLVILPDDSIVLSSSIDAGANGDDWVVTRLTSSGALDTSFGVSGLREIDFDGLDDIARDVLRTPSGHIVVVGSAFISGNGTDRAIFVLDANGNPESSFGTAGEFVLPPLPDTFEVVFSGVVQPDGKLLMFTGRFNNLQIERYDISSGLVAEASLDVTDDEVPLIGIDFGAGALPTNWTQVDGTTTDFTEFDLIDETGATTVVDAAIDFDVAAAGYIGFAPPASQLPAHTQSLAGLDWSHLDDLGRIIVTFQDLTPGQVYEVYVFGGDTLSGSQQVTITGSTVTQFDYSYNGNELYVNSMVGTNAPLETFAELMAATGAGTIQIQVNNFGADNWFGLAGLAIRESDQATELSVSIDMASISENGGLATGTVTRNGTAGEIMVSLSSDDTSEATVPAMVTIPDGMTSATFPITGVDDPIVDGTQPVTVTATATGLSNGSEMLDVTDDDVAPITLIVDTDVDESDGDFSMGDLSLREAIELANLSPGADFILFDAGLTGATITLDPVLSELLITEDVTITGLGSGLLTVSGGSATRIFHVDGGGPIDVEIVAMTLTGGNAIGQLPNQDGGALVNVGGNVTLTDVVATGNHARFGGAFASTDGSLTITDSTIAVNTASIWGAGISNLQADVVLTRVILDSNTSAVDAGAMYANGTMVDRAAVTLVDTHVTNNMAPEFGGAFFFSARTTFVATNSLFTGNKATGGAALGGVMFAQTDSDVTFVKSEISNNQGDAAGGALVIFESDLRLETSTVADNTSGGLGAGIAFSDLSLMNGMTIVDSTISGNVAGGDGGGILSEGGLLHQIINSTISGNSAAGVGGGIEDRGGTLVIRNSTITRNRADSDGNSSAAGGGIYLTNTATNSLVTLHNTIVAGNVSGMMGAGVPDDVNTGTGASLVGASSNNLIGDAATAGGLVDAVLGNIVGVAGVGTIPIATILDTTLGGNGGPTWTHALVPGSPAIDAGDNAQAVDENSNPLITDQRVYTRIFGGTVDVGAVEDGSTPLYLPGVTGVSINGGSANRSGIATIALTFFEATTISSVTALTLFEHVHPLGTSVDLTGAILVGNGTTTVTLDLTGLVTPLADGRYTLELPAAETTPRLFSTFAFEFWKLSGDVNGDAIVNFDDTAPLSLNFGVTGAAPYSDGDADGDGDVNFDDTAPLSLNFGAFLGNLGFDFGDAPEAGTFFPTTLAANGARHVTTGITLLLRGLRDSDLDGQPTASADGDDTDGVDDEGGVSFASLERGNNVTVTVSSFGSGFVNAWMDFNQDGDWDDPGEQVLTDAVVVDGDNDLQIHVPGSASLGSTIARFRLTGTAGYSYFGMAPSGEVEDYQVSIVDPAPDVAADMALQIGVDDGEQQDFDAELDPALTEPIPETNEPADDLALFLAPVFTTFDHPLTLLKPNPRARAFRG